MRSINTWTGVKVVPQVSAGGGSSEWGAGKWLAHAAYLFPNELEREVVLDYLACIVQRLAVKPSWWIIHRGGFGVGKDLFYRAIVDGLGDAIARCVGIDRVIDGWGDYLKDMKFCIVTEVDKESNRKVSNAMKTFCAPSSSGFRQLNMKGGAVLKQRDVMGGVMMANKRACLAIEPGERRYFVVDSYMDPQSMEYYLDMVDWYENRGGIQSVMDYLGSRDISAFNPHQLPFHTDGYHDLLDKSRYDYEEVVEESMDRGDGMFSERFIPVSKIREFIQAQGLKCGLNGFAEVMVGHGYTKVKPVMKVSGRAVTHGWYWVNEEDAKLGGTELYRLIQSDLDAKVKPFSKK